MFTKSKTILSAVTMAALLGASFSTIANAEAGAHGGNRMGQMFNFEEMDSNGDGMVTQEEIAAQRAAKIAAMDTDGDGNLSEAELLAAQEARKAERQTQMAKRMIERMDANKDGVLSLEEMAPSNDRGVKMFKRIDTDGDGAISKAEADAAKEKMGQRMNKRDGKRGDKHDGKRMHRDKN